MGPSAWQGTACAKALWGLEKRSLDEPQGGQRAQRVREIMRDKPWGWQELDHEGSHGAWRWRRLEG